MEEQKAHELFRHFSDVHAAAKSGRVIIYHNAIQYILNSTVGQGLKVNLSFWTEGVQGCTSPFCALQGLGFNAGGSSQPAYSAVDNNDRWQPDARHDILNSDSSRAETSKRIDRKHESAREYTRHSVSDKDVRRADTGRPKDKQDRFHSAREADRRHEFHGLRYRSEGTRFRADDRHESSRDNHHNRRSHHTEHGSGSRHDREQRRDRSALHDCRSREDRSKVEHCSGKGRSSRQDYSSIAKEKKIDFERAIPGYAALTAAERMKARTKFLLDKSSKQVSHPSPAQSPASPTSFPSSAPHLKKPTTSVLIVQDDRDVKGGHWTRYVFNQVCTSSSPNHSAPCHCFHRA